MIGLVCSMMKGLGKSERLEGVNVVVNAESFNTLAKSFRGMSCIFSLYSSEKNTSTTKTFLKRENNIM